MFRFGAGADDDDELAAGGFGVDAGDALGCEVDEEEGRGTGVVGLLTGVPIDEGTFLTGADDAPTPFAGDEVKGER